MLPCDASMTHRRPRVLWLGFSVNDKPRSQILDVWSDFCGCGQAGHGYPGGDAERGKTRLQDGEQEERTNAGVRERGRDRETGRGREGERERGK